MTHPKRFYSPSTRGFYLEEHHAAEHIPADAVAITERRRQELLAEQTAGATIEPDPKSGKPRAVHPSRDSRAEIVAAIKREARRRIEAVSPVWRQLNDTREPSAAGAARFAAIDAIRAASSAIESEVASAPVAALAGFPLADHPLWPSDGADR